MAGVGVLALATGLTALVAVGSAGFAVLVGAIQQFLAIVPQIAIAMATAAVVFLEKIAEMTPRVVEAFVKMVSGVLDATVRLAPKFGQTLTVMINVGLRVLNSAIPRFITVAFNVINAFLNAAMPGSQNQPA